MLTARINVKRTTIRLFLAALVTLSPIGAWAQVIDKPAATVNLVQPQYISVSELDARYKQMETLLRQSGQPSSPDEKMKVLENMIAEILISQAAKRDNITVPESAVNELIDNQRRQVESRIGPLTDDQYHNFIYQQTGMSWNEYVKNIREQLTRQQFIIAKKGDLINNVPQPTEGDIENRYQLMAPQLTNPEIIRFNQVFIDTRGLSPDQEAAAKQRAEEIYRKYLNGQDTFAQLVTKYTDDPRGRYTGGDFGYLARDDARYLQLLGQTFMDSIFRLKVGDVKLLKSNIGYHIVQITEHYPPKLLTLNDHLAPGNPMTVHDYIRNLILQQEKQQAFEQAVNEIVDKLKKEADIQIFKQNLN